MTQVAIRGFDLDTEFARRIRKLHNYGSKVKYDHQCQGYNSRADELRNLSLIFQWATQMIPANGPVAWGEVIQNQYDAVPQRITGGVGNYFLQRKAMMMQLEEQDVDRQHNTGQQAKILVGNKLETTGK